MNWLSFGISDLYISIIPVIRFNGQFFNSLNRFEKKSSELFNMLFLYAVLIMWAIKLQSIDMVEIATIFINRVIFVTIKRLVRTTYQFDLTIKSSFKWSSHRNLALDEQITICSFHIRLILWGLVFFALILIILIYVVIITTAHFGN